MDSITQAALGAAVAEAGWGKKLGNRAIVWGAVWGTLPDLDVLAHPWLDDIAQLSWHRGISHSLLFMVLASPLLGWLFMKCYPSLRFSQASLTLFFIFFTHVLIDCFTVYGTQIFEPFSSVRVGFNNLFIIDPLYTLPLLVGLVLAWRRTPDSWSRRRANFLGLAISSVYVLWSFTAKEMANHHFQEALAAHSIQPKRLMTAPGPFQTFTWRLVAEDDTGFWIGQTRIFPFTQAPVALRFVPKNEHLLDPDWVSSRTVEKLKWFSEGFYCLYEENGRVHFVDLRFSELPGAGAHPRTFFTWQLDKLADRVVMQRLSRAN